MLSSSTNITKIAIAFRIYCQVTIWLFVIELLSWEYYYHCHKSIIKYEMETSSSSSIFSCPSAVMIDSSLRSIVGKITRLWLLIFVMNTRKWYIPHDNVTFRAVEGTLCFRGAFGLVMNFFELFFWPWTTSNMMEFIFRSNFLNSHFQTKMTFDVKYFEI